MMAYKINQKTMDSIKKAYDADPKLSLKSAAAKHGVSESTATLMNRAGWKLPKYRKLVKHLTEKRRMKNKKVSSTSTSKVSASDIGGKIGTQELILLELRKLNGYVESIRCGANGELMVGDRESQSGIAKLEVRIGKLVDLTLTAVELLKAVERPIRQMRDLSRTENRPWWRIF